MRRTLATLAAGALLAGIAPALAHSGGTEVVRSARLAGPSGPVLDRAVSEQMASAPHAPLTVLVHGADLDGARRAAEAAGLRLVSEYPAVSVVAAEGLPASVSALADDPAVVYVEHDRPIQWFLDTAHQATRADEARDPATGLLRPDGQPYDGSGVTIAINDSGVDGTHPMFEDEAGATKVVRNVRAVAAAGLGSVVDLDVGDSDTANGHGTHVAGIAAGFERVTADGRLVRGAAPGADLVAYGSGLGLSITAAADGLQWVLDHADDPCGDGSCPPIQVVNNSWGSTGDYNPDSVIGKLSDALVGAGVVVVFAAGNGDEVGNGGDGSSNLVNRYAQNPTPGVIGVANYSDGEQGSRDNGLNTSSSRGEKGRPETYPDLAAPGTLITSACSYLLPICRSYGDVADPHYAAISGTSMAAPYVAGVVALLLEADPTLTPAQIEDLLEDNAYAFGDPASYEDDPGNPDHQTSFDKGHGLVDVAASLAAALGQSVVTSAACTGDFGIVDAPDDATDVVVPTGAPGTVSEPGLDIVGGDIVTTADGDLVFAMDFNDLGEAPPSASTGEHLRFVFTYHGTAFQISALRYLPGPAEAVRFSLETYDLPRERLIDLTGTFDPVTDRVSVLLPDDAFNVWNSDYPVLAAGERLETIELVSQRYLGVSTPIRSTGVTPTADTAPAGCAYVVGG